MIAPGLGSGGARRALLGGALDLAVTSKPGNAVERTEGTVPYRYGSAPFLVAVAQSNPVTNLSTRELVEIYGGTITSWPNGQRLRVILRPETEPDTEVLKSISSDMERALKAAHSREGMMLAVTEQDSAKAIETVPGAIGISGLASVLAEKRAMKGVSINGRPPSVKAIADGTYPWFKTYYLLTKREPSASSRLFLEFVLSPGGRQILSLFGHWLPEAQAAR
jgi:phosphate transport system substrate-binding protein